MEQKTPKEIINAISIAIMIVIFLVIGALIVSSVLDTSTTNCTPSASGSNSQNILSNDSATLSPIGLGITSNLALIKNKTWLNCSTDDSIVFEVSQSKATISLWFNNATTDWTSIIKSDGDIYIDGSLDGSWVFLPYFISADTITLCKSDGSTFLNVSIDEVRVYETALNSSEVTAVFNDGR